MKTVRALPIILCLMLLPACEAVRGIDLFGDPPVTQTQAPPVDNTPAGLFAAGQYQKAYAALQPALLRGEPDAVFYALTIRKHGLDGRAANPEELHVLWDVLLLRAETMRRALYNPGLAPGLKNAYAVALAQLAWFSAPVEGWPPSPHDNPIARERAAALAARYLSTVVADFTPAMNFMAYLYLDYYASPAQAFAATRIAAERGDFLAMGNLAYLVRTGTGTEKNDLWAAHLARRGATSLPPVPRNQNEMGNVYEIGLGVTPDVLEAARWYTQSAAQGHPAGLFNEKRLKQKKTAPPTLDNEILF